MVNQDTVRKMRNDSNLNLPASKQRGRTKSRNLFMPSGQDQLCETDITYIPKESGMNYLMFIKDCFINDWQEYQYSRSCLTRNTIRFLENAVLEMFHTSLDKMQN